MLGHCVVALVDGVAQRGAVRTIDVIDATAGGEEYIDEVDAVEGDRQHERRLFASSGVLAYVGAGADQQTNRSVEVGSNCPVQRGPSGRASTMDVGAVFDKYLDDNLGVLAGV